MKWVERNGKRYLYINRRVGGRVRSIYVGAAGPATELLERVRKLVKAERAADAANWQLTQQRLAASEATIEALFTQFDALEPELSMPDHGDSRERTA